MGVPLFFDVSGGELLVVLLFVLLFFGSKGVPDIARTMGRAMRQLRDATADVQREIEKGANEVKKGFEEQRKTFRIEPPEHASPQRGPGARETPGPAGADTKEPTASGPDGAARRQDQAPAEQPDGQ